MPPQKTRPWYRLQHFYIWPLYTLMVLRWQTAGDVAAFVRGSIGHSPLRLPRRWDLVGVIAGKAIFIGWALVVPLLVYPWWVVLAGYVALRDDDEPRHRRRRSSSPTASRRPTSPPSTSSAARSASGPCTRSRRRSTSARATPSSRGCSAGSTTRSSTTSSRGCRTPTTPRIAEIVQRNSEKHGVRYTRAALALVRPPLALQAPAHHGPAGRSGRDRDGVAPQRKPRRPSHTKLKRTCFPMVRQPAREEAQT